MGYVRRPTTDDTPLPMAHVAEMLANPPGDWCNDLETPSGAIYVDKTTYRRLGARYIFSEPQELMFKGKGKMTVYQLLGRRAS